MADVTTQQHADLERRVAELEARLNQISIASERGMETQSLFPSSGSGTNGTSKQAARADHTH